MFKFGRGNHTSSSSSATSSPGQSSFSTSSAFHVPSSAASAIMAHHHHHHHSSRASFSVPSSSGLGPLENNPLGQHVEVGRYIGTSGPEFVWKIYDAWRKSDAKELSVFLFEKKCAEKLHKPKRKETITEILRSSVRQLERFRHPKILQVVYGVEECGETLAFATEPVLASLQNVLVGGDKGHDGSETSAASSQIMPFLDIELKYGLLQITEALQFLHYSGKVLHRNVCPSSIIITKRGTWKLSGLEFIERANEVDGLEPIHVMAWTAKVPKMGQPDLDYTAPEVQVQSMCSFQSDMFSLGMVIATIFNGGKPLIQSNHSNSSYIKQIDTLDSCVQGLVGKVPGGLQEALQRLLSREPRQRPTSQLLALIKYFSDGGVHALQYLDVIQMKDPSQKANFYRNQLRDVLPFIPKKLWYGHIWPALKLEMKTQEVLAAVLQPILFMIQEATITEFDQIILPPLREVFNSPKSIQATVTILENLHIILAKNCHEELIKTEILPMVFAAFDSTTLQVQNAALVSVSLISAEIDVESARRVVLPKTKAIYEKHSTDLKAIVNVLSCIEKIMDKLERPMIIDDVLPLLYDNAKLQDPDVIARVVQIYRLMLAENKKYGLSVNLMATRVMPSLLPQTVNPALDLDQFSSLVEVMQDMLDHIDRNQRNKLKLDRHISLGSPPGNDHHGYHLYNSAMSLNPRHPSSATTSLYNVVVPNVHVENSTGPGDSSSYSPYGYPGHHRINQRKTSSAEDMMSRKSSTGSGDETNFLRVAAFPIRRLSDNTLMTNPKMRLTPSSALSSPGSGDSLPARRHSSIGPERKASCINLSPPAGGSMPNTSSFSQPSMFSASMSSLRSRRTSIMNSTHSLTGGHLSARQSPEQSHSGPGILYQLGTGVYQLFGGNTGLGK